MGISMKSLKRRLPKNLNNVAKANVDVFTLGKGGEMLGLGDKPKQPGEPGYAAQQQSLQQQSIDNANNFIKGGAPKYNVGENLEYEKLGEMERLGASEMDKIATDSRYKNAELDALRALQERSTEGLSKQDEADMLKLRQDTDRRNRGRQGAIEQNMAQRGVSGSGIDLLAQLQGNQDATEAEALASIQKAAQMQNNKRAAANDLGNMSAQMQAKDFQQQAAKAAAADQVARYNNQNTNQRAQYNNQAANQAAQQNWNRQNTTNDNQVNADYGFRKDVYSAQNTNINNQSDWLAAAQNRRDLERQQKAAKKSGMFGTLGAVAGGVAGAYFGGPMGAAAGASAGGQIGQGLGSNFAHGGTIPGPIWDDFDDEKNDIFQANLSPGEVVLPKSVAKDPVAAGQFVANENKKQAMDPAMLDYMAKSDPELVARYREKMAASNEGVKKAQDMQDMGSYANVIGNVLTDYNNSQKQDIIQHQSMREMARNTNPNVIKAERKEWDGSAIDAMGKQGVARAQANKADTENGFWNEQKLQDLSTKRSDDDIVRNQKAAMADSNSEQSIAARAMFAKNVPGIEKTPGFERMTADQVDKYMGGAFSAYNAGEQRKDRDEERRQRAADRSVARESTAAIRGASADAKKEADTDKAVERFSKSISGVQETSNAIAKVEAKLGFNLDDVTSDKGVLKGKNGKEIDLPGVSVKGLGRLDLWQNDAQELESAVGTVFNTELKDRSGAAVTNNEMERLKKEFGSGQYNTEAQMVQALKDYKAAMVLELKNREAGFSPDVRETYENRGGQTSSQYKTAPTKPSTGDKPSWAK